MNTKFLLTSALLASAVTLTLTGTAQTSATTAAAPNSATRADSLPTASVSDAEFSKATRDLAIIEATANGSVSGAISGMQQDRAMSNRDAKRFVRDLVAAATAGAVSGSADLINSADPAVREDAAIAIATVAARGAVSAAVRQTHGFLDLNAEESLATARAGAIEGAGRGAQIVGVSGWAVSSAISGLRPESFASNDVDAELPVAGGS